MREYRDPPEYRDSPSGGGLALPSLTPVTKWALIVCGALFVVSLLTARFALPTYLAVEEIVVLSPDLWRAWFPVLPVWQLLTYGLMHSVGDPMHVLYNLLVLYFFGTSLEGVLGSRRYLAHLLIAVFLGGLLQLLLNLATGSSLLTLGASGGALFVIVALATLQPNARVIFLFFPITLRTLALILVGLDLYRLLVGSTDVAWLVHLTGAAYGFAGVRKGFLWKDPAELWRQRREEARVQAEEGDEQRLDALLQKIHREGMHALSKRERAFLKRVSSRR